MRKRRKILLAIASALLLVLLLPYLSRSPSVSEMVIRASRVPLLTPASTPQQRQRWQDNYSELQQKVLPLGREAIPDLTQLLNYKDTRGNRVYSGAYPKIAQFLPRAVPGPVDTNEVVAHALRLLWELGPDAAPAVPALTEYARCNTNFVRIGAINVLGRIGPKARSALPVLLDCAKSSDWRLAAFSLQAATAIAGGETEVQAALQRALANDDIVARVMAANSVSTNDALFAKAKFILAEAVATQRAGTYANSVAFNALRTKCRADPEVLPAWIQALTNGNAMWQWTIIEAIRAYGPNSREAIPALLTAWERNSAGNHSTLGWLGAPSPAQVESIIPFLESPDRRVRIAAAECLARGGPELSAAIPALRKAAASEDGHFAWTARKALQRITPDLSQPFTNSPPTQSSTP
jgi:hypothetical protein